MSSRGRRIVALALAAAVAGAAAWIALRGEEFSPPEPGRSESGRPDVFAQALEGARRSQGRELRRAASHAHADHEPGPPLRFRRHNAARRKATPVARRFVAAFARYERGEDVAAELRATVTPRFAQWLLRSPPRRLLGVGGGGLVLDGSLDLVPLGGRPNGPLTALELVGRGRRGGDREPLAVRLHRLPAGWRVAGLGL